MALRRECRQFGMVFNTVSAQPSLTISPKSSPHLISTLYCHISLLIVSWIWPTLWRIIHLAHCLLCLECPYSLLWTLQSFLNLYSHLVQFSPSSCWCHPAISSSVIPFSSCPQSLLASESSPTDQLFAWGGQSIGVSASASVLKMNTQDWSLLEWTGWISLQSKGLSRVFSNTTVQKHQFFSAQLSSQSNSHIHTWPQEKP